MRLTNLNKAELYITCQIIPTVESSGSPLVFTTFGSTGAAFCVKNEPDGSVNPTDRCADTQEVNQAGRVRLGGKA